VPVVFFGLGRAGVAVIFQGGQSVGAGQPAVEIHVSAAARAERAQGLGLRLAADNAGIWWIRADDARTHCVYVRLPISARERQLRGAVPSYTFVSGYARILIHVYFMPVYFWARPGPDAGSDGLYRSDTPHRPGSCQGRSGLRDYGPGYVANRSRTHPRRFLNSGHWRAKQQTGHLPRLKSRVSRGVFL
jgi:hypothetical protein